MRGEPRLRPGFTLVELLVVVSIVGLVSVLALPMVLSAYGERGIQEGARAVQAAIVSARDQAARDGRPCGIAFREDPALPGFASLVLPLSTAPDYTEGRVTTTDPATLPEGFAVPYPCLMVEQAIRHPDGRPCEPTSWAYNVRVGDRLRITPTSPRLTVVGPASVETAEGFVSPARPLIRRDAISGKDVAVDYLWLVNGVDDDRDGFADEGHDGVDNDADGVTDEPDEWEVEVWRQPPVVASTYALGRRPVPSYGTRFAPLPASVVVDLEGLPREIMIDASGRAMEAGPYGVPTRIGLKGHEYRIKLVGRGNPEVTATVVLDARTGRISTAGELFLGAE